MDSSDSTGEPRYLFRSVLIFSILSALYILSMFHRVSNAVIAPSLIEDLNLDAETLGILGGAYFYSFTLIQIPMGPMLDRIGPRMVISSFAFIGALGAFLFAFSHSFYTAFWGRILIGLGMAAILMSSLKVFTLRFSPKQFATLMGTLVSIGSLGSILAASPLAYFNSTIGWRLTIAFAGGISIILAYFTYWILGREEGKRGGDVDLPISSSPGLGIFQSLRVILGTLAFWQGSAVSFFRYGTFIALQGLWLGPYLMNIKGYAPLRAGNILILMALGGIVGGPISGRFSDQAFPSRKVVALVGLSLYALCLLPLTGVVKIENPFGYGVLFFFMGFFNTFGMGVYSHIKELFPLTIAGTVMTWINFFNMAGVAIFMPLLGKIIGSFQLPDHSYPPEAYHLSFLICFLSIVASLIFYGFSKRERHGESEKR
jgi:MFS family permease